MAMVRRIGVMMCLMIVILGSLPIGTIVVDAEPTTETEEVSVGPPEINTSIERVGEESASVTITAGAMNASIDELQFVVREGTVVNASGFTEQQRENGNEGEIYRWDGETENPSFIVEVGESNSANSEFTATKEWYFGETPTVEAYWIREDDEEHSNAVILGEPRKDVGRTGTVSFVEEGIVGQQYLYIGPYEEETIAGNKTAYRFVKAAGATVSEPKAKTEQFSQAQPYLRGTPSETVTIFVLPDPMPNRGAASPVANEFWINQNRSQDSPSNVWLHEYIHTQQTPHKFGPRMEWYPEGATTYQTGVLSAQVGDVSADESQVYLSQTGYRDVVLANKSTWKRTNGDYLHGGMVMFTLDSKIRSATDGKKTIQTVFSEVSEKESVVTYAVFREIVVTESNEEVGKWLDTHVLTNESPDPPEELLVFPESSRVNTQVEESSQTVTPGTKTVTIENNETMNSNEFTHTPVVLVTGVLLILLGMIGVVRKQLR